MKPESSIHSHPSSFLVSLAIGAFGMVLMVSPGLAAESSVPWECTEYEGDVQRRCVEMFAELQQRKIEQLEKELAAQQRVVQELQEQMNTQADMTKDLEEKLDRTRYRDDHRPWNWAYPPWGFSLRFGRDGLYGGSYYYGAPYHYGPRYYHPRHRRWHRHW